jgi:hypothetical protein
MSSELIIGILGLLLALAAFVVGWASFRHPQIVERKNQRILRDKFSRGPYDRTTIEQSTRYYVEPKCSNIDPAQEQEIRHALIATKEKLFDKVDYFLDHDTSQRHLLILADSGMGKTSFVLNYYIHNERRSARKRHRLALIPLGIKDAEKLIAELPGQEETVILLDALDEDVKAIADHEARIRFLMEACRGFKRVIITCRTQFFAKDDEIPIETGVVRLGPRRAGERGMYEFWKLYLAPLDDNDVNKYLKLRYPIIRFLSRRKARNIVLKIPLLSARPMLLTHIPDIVSQSIEITYAYQLYEIMINAWIEREQNWIDKQALRELSERLAVNIYVSREARGMETVPHGDLPTLSKEWGIELQPWQISGRSLLNRDATGGFKFAHRSIMEYLFVWRLIHGDRACYGVPLTDQMKTFLADFLSNDSSLETDLLNRFVVNLDLVAKGNNDDSYAKIHDSLLEFKQLLQRIDVYDVEMLDCLWNGYKSDIRTKSYNITSISVDTLRKADEFLPSHLAPAPGLFNWYDELMEESTKHLSISSGACSNKLSDIEIVEHPEQLISNDRVKSHLAPKGIDYRALFIINGRVVSVFLDSISTTADICWYQVINNEKHLVLVREIHEKYVYLFRGLVVGLASMSSLGIELDYFIENFGIDRLYILGRINSRETFTIMPLASNPHQFVLWFVPRTKNYEA